MPASYKFQRARPAPGFRFGRLKRIVRLGIKTLWLHRLRSLLTVLGIVFGVCSMIAMLAIGEGASYEAQEQIKNLGSQNIILKSVKPPEAQKISEKNSESYVLQYGLTYADIDCIQHTIPGVTVIVPGRIMRETVWNISRFVDCEIVGTVPWYPEMRNHPVAQGRFFTDVDARDKASVCVLGGEMAGKLFPLGSALGGTVRVKAAYYRVVGIMERQGSGLAAADDSAARRATAHRMYIPLETARIRFGEVLVKQRAGSSEVERIQLHEVTVKVASREQVMDISLAVKDVLERNHKKQDFEVTIPLELLRRAERTKQIFNIVLGSIAAISLLVGGIGIMNIMLASVTERTREIGVRRALGARRRDIVVQFLVETVMLSAAGGVLGVLIGVAIPWLVSAFAGMKTIVTPWSPILAFTISGFVGVIFGLYPALRAARMNPVEALRHE